MLRNVLEASATTFCAASSQLFGDSESISITFTIFGMSLISFPLQFRTTLEIWPQALLGSRVGRLQQTAAYAAAVTCRIVSCNFCTSIGLVRCAEKPARLLRSTSSSIP